MGVNEYCTDDILNDYKKEVDKIPYLSSKEEEELFIRVSRGDVSAKKKIATSYSKFVLNMARHFFNKGFDPIDIIMIGNIGLLKAIDKFDLSKGCKFATYAGCKIIGEIKDELLKSNSVKLSVPDLHDMNKCNIAKYELEKYFKNEELIKEISKKTGFPIEKVEFFLKMYEDTRIKSLDISIDLDDKDGNKLCEFISSEEESIEETIILKVTVQDLLNNCKLTEKRKKVLELLYGLNGNKQRKYKEIAEELGITISNVNSFHIEALKKIRNFKYIDEFAVYMDDKDAALKYINDCRSKKRQSY